jgi:hypothetical protein
MRAVLDVQEIGGGSPGIKSRLMSTCRCGLGRSLPGIGHEDPIEVKLVLVEVWLEGAQGGRPQALAPLVRAVVVVPWALMVPSHAGCGNSPGEQATIEKLRQEVGRGSLTTLLRLRNEILEPETPKTDRDPEALNAFRQIWQSAVEAGRKGEAAKTAEAR